MKNEGIPSVFHGQEYASNCIFYDKYKDEVPPEMAIVGMALCKLSTQQGHKAPDQVLVWVGNQAIGMTKERYESFKD